jgi:hypothetical protein
MSHSSKFDVYLAAAIVLAIVVFLMGDYWIAGPMLPVLFLAAYPQWYETTREGLVIHTALGRQFIPYRAISSAAPGVGGAGVAIRFGCASEIRIRPAKPDVFFADLASRAPHLVKRGERLTAAFA